MTRVKTRRLRDELSPVPDAGTVTLEAWKRLRNEEVARDLHVVRWSERTNGDDTA